MPPHFTEREEANVHSVRVEDIEEKVQDFRSVRLTNERRLRHYLHFASTFSLGSHKRQRSRYTTKKSVRTSRSRSTRSVMFRDRLDRSSPTDRSIARQAKVGEGRRR